MFGGLGGLGQSFDFDDINGQNGFVIQGAAQSDQSRDSVAGLGDINGDGFLDILIGVPNANASATGAAFVVFGSGSGFAATIDLANLDLIDGVRRNGVGTGDGAGNAVSAVGDVNGKGLDEILIDSPQDDGGGLTAGSTTVLFGSYAAFSATFDLCTLDAAEGFRIDGADSNDQSGSAVSAAGDINGDGLADILVVGPSANGSAGESNVIFGAA